ncbi:MAG: FHA domain-containing protein [Myxococcota bacterium]
MEKTELLDALNGLTKKYEQHRHYIEKARAQQATGKFNAQVIEKVILDHEIKSSDVAEKVNPLLPELHALLTTLEAEKANVNASKGGVDEQIQEFELRHEIGELDDDSFEKEVADLRKSVAGANERIAAIDGDLGDLHKALEGWVVLAEPAGHYTSPAQAPAEPEPAAEPVVEAAPAETEAVEADADEPSVDLASEAGSHVKRTEIREDVSVVFDGPSGESGAAVRVAAAVEEEISIETAEGGEEVGDAPSADVQFGFEDDILGGNGDAGGEVEIDLAGEPAEAKAEEEAKPADDDGKGEAPRRALLLYQEGTAEEQIYPFTGDIITIGRGRENDIQIKNDSKVSRYHCKIFRRGNNFYIEDQKSSNGSLVNGELVTDRRLFGGEEIVIGETFFRFRIME